MPPSEHSPVLSRKKLAILAIKVAVSLGLLVYLISRTDVSSIVGAIGQADFRFIGLALLTPFAGYFITSKRWQGLLHVQGAEIPQGVLLRSCMVAMFFNQIMPSTIGGDVVRAYDSSRSGAGRQVALSAILVDRVMGLFALSLFAVGSLFILRHDVSKAGMIPLIVIVIAGGLACTVTMVFSPIPSVLHCVRWFYRKIPGPVGRFLSKLDLAFESYRGRYGIFFRALALSLVLQINVVVLHYLAGRALGLTPHFTQYFYVVPIALFVMLIPISINGIGIREGIFTLLLSSYGVGKPEALAFSFLVYSIFFLHGILGGLVFLTRGLHISQLVTQQESAPAGGGP